MSWRLFVIPACAFVIAGRISAQEVVIVRELKPKISPAEQPVAKEIRREPQVSKVVTVELPAASSPVPHTVAQSQPPIKATSQSATDRPRPAQSRTSSAAESASAKPEIVATSSTSRSNNQVVKTSLESLNYQGATAFTKLADGFDFPIGKPDTKGYYKARGFREHGHLGEDWDGLGGGDTDLGDPIYCIGNGVVVFARDCKLGWGNVIIVRHAFRENGTIKNIDSFYGHLQRILVRHGQRVERGQQIATMGNAHGLYDAHLHFEIRKNIEIGMSRAAFARDYNNYYDPTQFIQAHRTLRGGGGSYRIALNTFTRDKSIRWEKKRYFSGYRGGGGESAVALKRALASQNATSR